MGFCHVSNGTIGLVGVCRNNDFISEEILHDSDVVNTLVGFPIFSHIQAIMSTDELEVRLVNVIKTMLVIRLIHTKEAEVSKEREKAKSRKRSDCPFFGLFHNFLGSQFELKELPQGIFFQQREGFLSPEFGGIDLNHLRLPVPEWPFYILQG